MNTATKDTSNGDAIRRLLATWSSERLAEQAATSVTPRSEFAHRVDRLRDVMERYGLDLLLVSHPATILWLTDFDMAGTFYFDQLIIPKSGDPVLYVKRAEADIAIRTASVEDVVIWYDGDDHIEGLRATVERMMGSQRRLVVGAETSSTSGWYKASDQRAVSAALGTELIDVGESVEALRTPVDSRDWPRVDRAAAIADYALAAGIGSVRESALETDVAGEILRIYHLMGGNEPPVWPMVASGPRACVPFATATGERMSHNAEVVLEVWANWQRFVVVGGTTVWIGAPPVEAVRRWSAATDALQAAASLLVPGATGGDVSDVLREMLSEFGERVPQTLGHVLSQGFPLRPASSVAIRPKTRVPISSNSVVALTLRILDREGPSISLAQTFRVTEEGGIPLNRIPLNLMSV